MGKVIRTAGNRSCRHWFSRGWTPEQARNWQLYCLHNRQGWRELVAKREAEAKAGPKPDPERGR
jgi:hypothetical protein